MGVRGLTSYIARNAEQYLRAYELHDCNLVIDGDNLACNLFKDVTNSNPAFGGDYDSFYRTVVKFFEMLQICNVRAFVLMDGGYEAKKIKTLTHRLRSKIGMVKHLNPLQSKPLFPLMMREVFIEAARESGANVMRCLFEADDELAALARKLNCPLLSYDSDFYIHNVKYIPLVTLTLKVQSKTSLKLQNTRNLRHCEAKNIAQRKHIKVGEKSSKETNKSKRKNVNYLDCCIYTIKNLAGRQLKTEMLPIFAALLGNDYIERKQFAKFYSQLGLRGINNTASKQEKRIRAILRWLRHETKESAIQKVVTKLPKEYRDRLLAQLESATSGYSTERCETFDYFGLNEEEIDFTDLEETDFTTDEEDIEVTDEEDIEVTDEEASDVKERVSDEEDDVASGDGENNEKDDNNQSTDTAGDEVAEEENKNEHDQVLDANEKEIITCLAQIGDMSNPASSVSNWLKLRILNGELPRYFSDLVHLRMYINNPLVENFLFEDCNEVALKILQYIFTIVNQPDSPDLRYLTRVVRLTNVHYKTIKSLELQFTYDPHTVDMNNFKAIFWDFEDHDKIFENIKRIPSRLQLYFLAISYWARKSQRATHIHLHSLIICMIALFIIDDKIESIRNHKGFQKKFGKIATKARNQQSKLAAINGLNQKASNDEGNTAIETLSSEIPKSIEKQQRPILERIKFVPKSDCILVMENLLKYFHLNECFQRRHNDFSSSILHGFSEFQNVFFHLSALNALFNYPFEATSIAHLYNGLFLYNMFANLRARVDIQYYALRYIFHESGLFAEYYTYLIDWCSEIISLLEKNDTNKPSKIKQKKNKKKIVLPLTDVVEDVNVVSCANERVLEDEKSSDSEYNDLNNKFSMLLKAR